MLCFSLYFIIYHLIQEWCLGGNTSLNLQKARMPLHHIASQPPDQLQTGTYLVQCSQTLNNDAGRLLSRNRIQTPAGMRYANGYRIRNSRDIWAPRCKI